MSIVIESFGKTKSGIPVDKLILTNASGLSCHLITYGAAIQALYVPGADGQKVDVVLGYDTLDGYESPDNPFHGSTVGRNANRIGGPSFDLNGKHYELFANDGSNNLHSLPDTFQAKVWRYEILSEGDEPAVRFSYHSPDGESGYPGNLDCSVTYTLTAEQGVDIAYDAVADQDTIINLTNHSYFNITGHNSGTVLAHELQLMADAYTPVSEKLLPDGRLQDVTGTPFDFRTAKPVGQDIKADDLQLHYGQGYDHNFVLAKDQRMTDLRTCAVVRDPASDRTMTVRTTSPGVQLYTGNYLNQSGKGGAVYAANCGMCLETQFFPDSPHQPHFPSPVYQAGERFTHRTVYQFS
ncbi:MAG: galactose mutarotase [Clostridia bacterium]|nr:galactose mutarotase [Clostridia bacterium]